MDTSIKLTKSNPVYPDYSKGQNLLENKFGFKISKYDAKNCLVKIIFSNHFSSPNNTTTKEITLSGLLKPKGEDINFTFSEYSFDYVEFVLNDVNTLNDSYVYSFTFSPNSN